MPPCPKPELQPGTSRSGSTQRPRDAAFKGKVRGRACSRRDAREQLCRARRALQKSASLPQNEGRDLFTQLLRSLLPTLQDHELPLLHQSKQDCL